MSHTTEPPCTHSTHGNKTPTPVAKRQHTRTSSVCSKSAVFAHTSADKARYLHACLTSLCVQQTNHPYTHTHTEGRVWQPRAGLFIDVLPLREADRERERKPESEGKEGKRESKVKGEECTDWTSKPPDSLHVVHTYTTS